MKTVHDIEIEANTLVALVATKEKMVNIANEQAQTILSDARIQSRDILEAARNEAAKIRAEIDELKQKEKQAREREIDDYEYTFNRDKRAKMDQVKDQIDQKLKELKVRVDEVTAREALANEKDKEISTLTNQILELKASIDKQIGDAVADAQDRTRKSADIAKAMMSKTHEAETSIKDAEIKSLKDQLAAERARLEKATQQVDAANEKVAQMAQSALKAQADTATISKVSEIAAGANKK